VVGGYLEYMMMRFMMRHPLPALSPPSIRVSVRSPPSAVGDNWQTVAWR